MIGKLFSTGIIRLILFNSLCRPLAISAAGEPILDPSDISDKWECPANNNSVCVKGYIHLVECFKDITDNQDNISFAFFPNNKASSLYVTVTYTIHHEHKDSGNATANSSRYIEEWVWSHTMVYIMYHPSLFKFLSLGYGRIDDRVNSAELTIPLLCHDNNDNHKLIERLTQMVCTYIKSFIIQVVFLRVILCMQLYVRTCT